MGRSSSKKSIASFEQVATHFDIQNNPNPGHTQKEDRVDQEMTSVKSEPENDLKQLVERSVDNEKVLRGIYFKKETARALSKLAKGKKKGFQSHFVDAAVQEALKRNGWWDN